MAAAFFDLTILFLMTQTKAQNIPLYLLFRMQYLFLSKPPSPRLPNPQPKLTPPTALLDLTPTATTLTTLLLSQTSFFALGTNNAISSIDLSTSYNGISSYSPPLVGLLVFLSNWAGPIYWSLAGILLLGGHGATQRFVDTSELHVADWVAQEHAFLHDMARKEEGKREARAGAGAWATHVALLTLWSGVMLASVMGACAVLRQHLFIWTVFSPKFLFAAAWGVAWHGGVTVGLGGLVWWLGTW